jgi:hypothetical protein
LSEEFDHLLAADFFQVAQPTLEIRDVRCALDLLAKTVWAELADTRSVGFCSST